MEWELWYTVKLEYMKANGKAILVMAEVWNATRTEINMKASLLAINLMAKDSIHGLMEKFMKANGVLV